MSAWWQNTFDPKTSDYNRKVNAANHKIKLKSLAKNAAYNNKARVAFKQAKWGAAVDQSIANSNVQSEAMANQYAAFSGFEEFSRIAGQKLGTERDVGTGESRSSTAEKGRTANYMSLLAKRTGIERGLRESFGASYHSKLHQNAVGKVNAVMAARDKVGMAPVRMKLHGKRTTNWGAVAFNAAKMGVAVASGVGSIGAGMAALKGGAAATTAATSAGFASSTAHGLSQLGTGLSSIGTSGIFGNQSTYDPFAPTSYS